MSARVRLEDLPPATRAQVVAALGRKPPRSRGSGGTTRGGRWLCGACSEPFTALTAAERHIDKEHHAARLEVVLLDNPGGTE